MGSAMRQKLSKQEQAFFKKQALDNMASANSRARSVTVGTCFGGVVEVMMRANNGQVLWCPLQPVEAIELIHQLAASVGCHIQLAPRRDFSSWREWQYTEEELAHYRGAYQIPGAGHPPHPHPMGEHMQTGGKIPPPTEQPGLAFKADTDNGETLAIEAPKQRRKSKRTAKTP